MVRASSRRSWAVLRRRWSALGLRWQLVVLNVIVIAATVLTIIVLMHNIAQQQFMVIMHAAGQPVDPAAGQRAYDAAVEAQIYPTIAVAAVVAVGLSFAGGDPRLEATDSRSRGDATDGPWSRAGRGRDESARRDRRRCRVRQRAGAVTAASRGVAPSGDQRRRARVANTAPQSARAHRGHARRRHRRLTRAAAAGACRARAAHRAGRGLARSGGRPTGERPDGARAGASRDRGARGRPGFDASMERHHLTCADRCTGQRSRRGRRRRPARSGCRQHCR